MSTLGQVLWFVWLVVLPWGNLGLTLYWLRPQVGRPFLAACPLTAAFVVAVTYVSEVLA